MFIFLRPTSILCTSIVFIVKHHSKWSPTHQSKERRTQSDSIIILDHQRSRFFSWFLSARYKHTQVSDLRIDSNAHPSATYYYPWKWWSVISFSFSSILIHSIDLMNSVHLLTPWTKRSSWMKSTDLAFKQESFRQACPNLWAVRLGKIFSISKFEYIHL